MLDRDSFPADHFDNAIAKAEANGINAAWSNEAFELWFLLHFEDRKTAMIRTEYQAKLSACLGVRYEKNDPATFERLTNCGDRNKANERAGRLKADHGASKTPPSGSNPCTTVHELVMALEEAGG